MKKKEFPKEVLDALERDEGITINRKSNREDTRFVYGASCTWFGSIHEVSSTKKHPRHHHSVKEDLPCCPVCGGMLFEMKDEKEWWEGIDLFEKGTYPLPTAHPGYRKMWEWQKSMKICFFLGSQGLDLLQKAYKEATGVLVDVKR